MKSTAVSSPRFFPLRLALINLCLIATPVKSSLAQNEAKTPAPVAAPAAGKAATGRSANDMRGGKPAQDAAITTVVASHPVVYGLLEALTRDSAIASERATPANLPASRHYSYLSGRGAKSFDRAVRNADAVVHLRSIWPDDPLYPFARKHNIRIVEIDAANPVDHALPGIAATEQTNTAAAYPWLSPVNMGRMADIIASDIQRLEPDAKDTVETNLAALRQRLVALNAEVESALVNAPNLSVVVISPRLHTLAAAFNLDVVPVPDQSKWDTQALAALGKTIKDNDVPVVLLHEAATPDLAAAITQAGAKAVVVETDGNDPLEALEVAAKSLARAMADGGEH
ncbi:MAG: metal ABC transporter substrate-binding protein [Advenella sp.]